MGMTIRYLLISLLFLNIGCDNKQEFIKTKHIITAEEAKNEAVNIIIEKRKYFLNELLTEDIAFKSRLGETHIWLLGNGYDEVALNSDDAKVLQSYGFKIEMCIDSDRIAYIRWE
jgi:hypothetical protein